MILHVFNDQKKFSLGFFKFLNDNNLLNEKTVLCQFGKKHLEYEDLPIDYIPLYSFFNPISAIKLKNQMQKADQIIIHSLASPFLLLIIILNPKIADRCQWVIWGKDLYFYHLLDNPKMYHKIYEFFRKKAIKKIKYTVSILQEDYLLLKKWYETNAENYECNLLYPYCIDKSPCVLNNEENNKYNILLGNSASKTNNHLDALDKLYTSKNDIEKIVCPLSYGGSKKYVHKVIMHGKKLFGDSFVPLIGFLPLEEYNEILSKTNMGIFNYNRQEGLGNIWGLIFKEKTIYINRGTSTDLFFKRIGITTKHINDIKSEGLKVISEASLQNNIYTLSQYLSEEKSSNDWKTIFNRINK